MRKTQAFGVIAHLRGKASSPERHGTWHRPLHMRVTRQHSCVLTLAERIERFGDADRACAQLLDDIAEVETQRREHLVIARTPQMNAAARGADALGKPLLKRRLAVLIVKLDAPKSAASRSLASCSISACAIDACTS